MLTIDGSMGEGGGQVLRTSVALAMVTGQPVRVENIRAGRRKPGLMRQHLTAVRAAARVCSARVSGDDVGSTAITFEPGPVSPGTYEFSVGTAGSATLVMQTVLPALLTAESPSELILEGGTHNPFAPPYDFLEKVFAPALMRLGVLVETSLERHGFYPAGGGRMRVRITPNDSLIPIEWIERGKVRRRVCRALIANLPGHIAERELGVVARLTGWDHSCMRFEPVGGSRGPGNVLMIELGCDHATELFTAFGSEGVRAEAVADNAVKQMRRYVAAEAPVGEYLADQLMLPLALAVREGGVGIFRTSPLSNHSLTQVELLNRFLDVNICVAHISDRCDEVRMSC